MTQPNVDASALGIPELTERAARDPIVRALLNGESTSLAAPLHFQCRGCGQHCCVNLSTPILITPPEAARIFWAIERNPTLKGYLEKGIRWGAMSIGGSTGLPLLRINYVPINIKKPDAGHQCPFLTPVFGGSPNEEPRWLGMAWCGIRAARPTTCRIFPLGRMGSGDGNALESWRYVIASRCPGFEPAKPGDAVPPGYTPPNDSQTVRAFLEGQIDTQQEEEKRFYLTQVIPAFMKAKLYAPTDDNEDGMLTERDAVTIIGAVLYSPPSAPRDSASDHALIMEWLNRMRDMPPTIVGVLQKARRISGEQPQADEQQQEVAPEPPTLLHLPADSAR